MPPLHTLAREVVEQIYCALPTGTARLRVVRSPEDFGPGYQIEVLPSSPKAAPITITVPENGWDAYIGCGECTHGEIWYSKKANASEIFQKSIREFLHAVIASHWEEQVTYVGQKLVSCLAIFPAPMKPFYFSVGLIGLLAPVIPSYLKKRKVHNWEPYVCNDRASVARMQ